MVIVHINHFHLKPTFLSFSYSVYSPGSSARNSCFAALLLPLRIHPENLTQNYSLSVFGSTLLDFARSEAPTISKVSHSLARCCVRDRSHFHFQLSDPCCSGYFTHLFSKSGVFVSGSECFRCRIHWIYCCMINDMMSRYWNFWFSRLIALKVAENRFGCVWCRFVFIADRWRMASAASGATGWYRGRVKAVPSGDCLVIVAISSTKPGPLPEKTITLSSLIAPRLVLLVIWLFFIGLINQLNNLRLCVNCFSVVFFFFANYCRRVEVVWTSLLHGKAESFWGSSA